jgi:hypothetical protein
MGKSKSLFSVTCIFLILLSWMPAFANEMAEKKAIESSNAWLKLVDEGQYSKSWETPGR